MRFNSLVRIISDRSAERYIYALSLRELVESFAFRVMLKRLHTISELQEEFARPNEDCSVTILNCHGWGKKDEDAVLNWVAGRPINAIEWESSEVHITPKNIGEYFVAGNGILICTACWSGKRIFADHFRKIGFSHLIAPEKTSDVFSANQFYAALFGYFAWEERDVARVTLSVEECVQRARKIDEHWDGANGFRCLT